MTESSSRGGTHIVEPIGRPIHWEPSIEFVKSSIAFLFIGCALFEVVLLTFYPDDSMRGLLDFILMFVAAAAWFFVARRKLKIGLRILGAGTWGYVTIAAFFLGGVGSTTIIIYPAIILLYGWLVSARAGIAVAYLTAATTLGLMIAETSGVLPTPFRSGPELRWFIQAAVFLFTGIVISRIVRSYATNISEIRTLNEDLASRGAELKAIESDLTRAQAIAHVGSWKYDIAQDVMHLSEETCRIFGVPAGVKGSRDIYLSRVHPEDRSAVNSAWQTALKGGAPFDNEHRILVGEAVRWVRQRAELETGPDGTPLRSVGITQDITERKRAEQRLKLAIEISQAVLWEWDLSNDRLKFDPAMLPTLGLDPEDRLDSLQSWMERIHPDDRRPFQERVELASVSTSPPFDFEYRMLNKSGTYRWIHSKGRVILRDADGRPKLAVGTSMNITERKNAEGERVQIEAQLRESQKMEALGTMAGGVAHDFNNALATIIGNTELARQDVGPGHPALVSLEEIGKASRRAKDIVQQILAFGRREKLERKATSLALVVLESARLIRATLPSGVSLVVDCKADTPPVLADETQVKQVLLNLCGNALQAVQDPARPGVIEIHLGAYDHTQGAARGELRPGRYACLTVRDNGPGMDEATRSRIFEPFFTTKPKGKGTGLGLSVVHGIVKAHEAGLEVESVLGQGSAFRIYFPAIDAPAEDVTEPKPDTARAVAAGKRVLYVDDEEAIVFLMTRLLERRGFSVSGYTDPREALAAVRADPGKYDLVVTDYSMPGMSGLQVAEALREIRADLPVVLASGYITEELRQKAPAAGVRELIYKPNTADDLCEAVARCANAESKIAS